MMSESLKHNITAMRQTQQMPSFVQVLVTFEAALEEIEQLRAALNNLDACAVPTAEQIEQMEKGMGAIFTPAMALKLGMKTAIGNVKRAMAAIERGPHTESAKEGK
jgi:hypothetical protein